MGIKSASVMPPVRSQGDCGACWAFAAAYVVEASLRLKPSSASSQGAYSLSVQDLVDCDRQFDMGCEGGNPLYAFEFIRDYGRCQYKNTNACVAIY